LDANRQRVTRNRPHRGRQRPVDRRCQGGPL